MKKTKYGRIAVVLIFVFAACGPSQRRTYQSDNAFARCFDRDYDPDVHIVQKKNCWNSWIESHQYNQQNDKVAYARLRLSEISDGISIPGPPGPPGSFHERPVLPKETKETKFSKGNPTSAECENGCRTSFEACSSNCPQDAGVDNTCKNACDAGYRSCMKTCFG